MAEKIEEAIKQAGEIPEPEIEDLPIGLKTQEEIDERKNDLRKIAIQELDRRGAIHWGLATSLKYDETLKLIVELLFQLEERVNKNES